MTALPKQLVVLSGDLAELISTAGHIEESVCSILATFDDGKIPENLVVPIIEIASGARMVRDVVDALAEHAERPMSREASP